jgi:DNA-binding MarR family transcriptional regulator
MAKTTSNLEDHLGYWLRFVSNHVSLAFTKKVEAKGVTVAEWVLMRQMYESGDCNPSQLADQLGITRGAISKLIERLCQKDLTTRTATANDRRYQSVALTTQGKRLVPALARLADENDQQFFGHLGDKQRTQLHSLLQELVQRHGWKDTPVS